MVVDVLARRACFRLSAHRLAIASWTLALNALTWSRHDWKASDAFVLTVVKVLRIYWPRA